MKGIYLTQEGKQNLEAKIAEIESYEGLESGMTDTLKEILSLAIILPLPVEESWEDVINKSTKINMIYDILYPNGVIIEPK